MVDKDIITRINQHFSGYHIVIWDSCIGGHYSPYGDVDVYVIGKIKPDINFKISGLILDIEYINIDDINRDIEIASHNSVTDLNKLKILYKIKTGIHIQKVYDFNSLIDEKRLLHYNQMYWNKVYVSLAEDIVKFKYSKNYSGNLFQIFYLLESAEAVYLTKIGIFCIKRKWIHTDFMSNFSDITFYNQQMDHIFENAKNQNFENCIDIALKLGDYLQYYKELKGGEKICD